MEAAAVPRDATVAGGCEKQRWDQGTLHALGASSRVEERFAKGWNSNRGRGGYELAK